MRKEFGLNNIYYFNYSALVYDLNYLIFDFLNYGFFFKLFWISDFLIGLIIMLIGLFGIIGKYYTNIYKLSNLIYNFVILFCFIFLVILFNNLIVLLQTFEFEIYFFEFFIEKIESITGLMWGLFFFLIQIL